MSFLVASVELNVNAFVLSRMLLLILSFKKYFLSFQNEWNESLSWVSSNYTQFNQINKQTNPIKNLYIFGGDILAQG